AGRAGKLLNGAVAAQNGVPPRFAREAAGEAGRTHLAEAREDGEAHARQETDNPQRAVSTSPAPLAAGATADGEAREENRIAGLQDLRVREARVRHVHVHGGRAIEARPVALETGRRARADGLVVLHAVVAERQVVHGPLGR